MSFIFSPCLFFFFLSFCCLLPRQLSSPLTFFLGAAVRCMQVLLDTTKHVIRFLFVFCRVLCIHKHGVMMGTDHAGYKKKATPVESTVNPVSTVCRAPQ